MTIDLVRMRARVRKPLGIVDPNDTDLTELDIDEYLNMSFWEVQDKFPFREKEKVETFGTAIGQRVYGNPSSTDAIKSFAVIDPVSGKHISLDWMDRIEHERIADDTVAARGIPQKYLMESVGVTFWPVPDAVYTIVRHRNIILADLAANATLVIPQVWIEIVIYGAVWRALIDFGDIERSTAIKSHQIALINTVTATAEKEQGDPRLTEARNEQTVQQQLKTINDTLALKLKEIDVQTQKGSAKFDSITQQRVKEIQDDLQVELKKLDNILQENIKTLDITIQPRLKKLDDAQLVELKKLDAILQPRLKALDNPLQLELKALDNILQFNIRKLESVLKLGIRKVDNVLARDLVVEDNTTERGIMLLKSENAKGLVDDFLGFWGSDRDNAGLEVRGRSYDQCDEPEPDVDEIASN